MHPGARRQRTLPRACLHPPGGARTPARRLISWGPPAIRPTRAHPQAHCSTEAPANTARRLGRGSMTSPATRIPPKSALCVQRGSVWCRCSLYRLHAACNMSPHIPLTPARARTCLGHLPRALACARARRRRPRTPAHVLRGTAQVPSHSDSLTLRFPHAQIPCKGVPRYAAGRDGVRSCGAGRGLAREGAGKCPRVWGWAPPWGYP